MDLTVRKQELNYSTKIKGSDLDPSITSDKFLKYDYAVQYNLFKPPVRSSYRTEEEYMHRLQQYKDAWALLDDNTIYAYAMLRYNNRPIKLWPYQDVIVNDTHKRIDVESANQVGKSFSLCVMAAIHFLRDHGKNTVIGLISKSMSQNSANMRMIKQMLRSSPLHIEPGDHDNMTVMTKDIYETDANGNIIEVDGKKAVAYTNTLVCSVASTSSLGFPFDYIYMDEFEFWDNPEGLEYMYDQIFEPRTFQTKGQIVIFSNPNGKNFVSENLQERKMIISGNPEFHVYNFNFLDNPLNTEEEWEQKKATTHPIIFASTMAAQRAEIEGSFLTDLEIKDSFNQELHEVGKHAGIDRQCYFFLDVGAVHDQSVLIGLYVDEDEDGQQQFNIFYIQHYPVTYPLWRVVGINPESGKFDVNDGWADANVESVRDVLKKYNTKYEPIFGADVTGHAAIMPLINAAGLAAIDITFSGPVKWKMYERFKTLMAKRLIKRVKQDNWINQRNQDWEYQARKLIINKAKGAKYYTIHHEHENDLDDAMDATVAAIRLADDGQYAQPDGGVVYGKSEDEGDMDEEFAKELAKPKQVDNLVFKW